VGAVEVLNRRDAEVPPRDEVGLVDRAHVALSALGAGGVHAAWQFPLRQPGLYLPTEKVLEVWNDLHGGSAAGEWEAQLVRDIRLWRPEIIVTQEASAHAGNPLGRLVHQAVLQAVTLAVDPKAHADQIARAGLEPWQVRRVYAALAPGIRGDTNVAAGQLAPRLARPLDDLTMDARAVIETGFHTGPPSLGFQVLFDQVPQNQERRDFFTGIPLAPRGDARRLLFEPGAETLDEVRRVSQKRRTIQAIIERAQRDPGGGGGLLAEANAMVGGMEPRGAAAIFYQLGQRSYQSGQWAQAAETFELLAERYPEDPLARPAQIWLVQYYTSGEAALRERNLRTSGAAIWEPSAGDHFVARPAAKVSVRSSTRSGDEFARRAAAITARLQQTHPELLSEPAVAFALAAADRKGSQPRQAERYYLGRSREMSHDAWWSCAQGELWLAGQKGPPPKPVFRCPTVATRPHLDGRLDDAMWRKAARVELVSPLRDDANWPATVLLAHDERFLYLGIRARQAPGAMYEPAAGTRPRDADLSAHDRIELLLDLDRGFATYFRLAVDHRGWTADDCWGDPTWNPTWFVASAVAEGEWTIEAAIPLDQLTGEPPAAGTAWAMGIQRIVPGVGFQSWNAPAAIDVVPEGFGYLIFE
jgi:hypothetical protein